MKNRNIPYYVAALMLAMGVSTSFVSCVDTDEPETVTKLRAAAQEKLQADIELQQALETLEAKTAENKRAQAALEKAKAQEENAKAAKAELANKVTEAGIDNATKAKIQEEIAAYETARKTAELQKLAAEKEIAQYQAELDKAQKQIEERLKSVLDDMPEELRIAKNLYMGYFDAGTTKVTLVNDYDADGNKIGSHYETTTTKGTGKFIKGTIQKLADETAAYNDALTRYGKVEEASLTADVDYAAAKIAVAEAQQTLYTKLFETEDLSSWDKEYQAAKSKIEALDIERDKNNAVIEQSQKTIAKESEKINDGYTEWLENNEKVYSYACSEALRNQIFTDDLDGYPYEKTYTGTRELSFKDDENKPCRAGYANGTITLSYLEESEYYTRKENPQNQKASKLLDAFLTRVSEGKISRYKFAATEKAEKELAWKNAQNSTEYLNVVKAIDGDHSEGVNAESDAYKGLKNRFDAAASAYSTATAENQATALTTLQNISNELYGNLYYQAPSEEEFRRNYGNYISRSNSTTYGRYGQLLAWNDYIADLKEVFDAYTDGAVLYAAVEKDKDQIETEVQNKNTEHLNNLASNENIVKARTAQAEAELANTYAGWEKDIYEELCDIASAILDNRTGAVTIDGEVVTFSDVKDLAVAKAKILAKCAKDVADAKADKELAEANLKAFQNGDYEKYDRPNPGTDIPMPTNPNQMFLSWAKQDMEEAEANNEAAKAYYEEMLKVYSTSSK
jgi:hypothetical protein